MSDIIQFPQIPDADRLPEFLIAEAKLGRALYRRSRGLFDHLQSVARVLNRAAELPGGAHHDELIAAATSAVNEALAPGFEEIDFPDMAQYPDVTRR